VLEMGGKRSAEKVYIYVTLKGISVFWNAEMLYKRITLKRPRRNVIAKINKVENAE
jgi:hypothetical protein